MTSFGTEGREKSDPSTAFVAPQEGIHAYLLFRGCDIKDLHVHEQQQESVSSQAAATETQSEPVAASASETAPTPSAKKADKVEDGKYLPPPPAVADTSTTATTKKEQESTGSSKKASATNNGHSQRRSNARRNTAAVGTGASLLNRKARGAVQGGTYRSRRINWLLSWMVQLNFLHNLIRELTFLLSLCSFFSVIKYLHPYTALVYNL